VIPFVSNTSLVLFLTLNTNCTCDLQFVLNSFVSSSIVHICIGVKTTFSNIIDVVSLVYHGQNLQLRNCVLQGKHLSFSPYNMLQVCYHGAATATISSPGTTTCRLLFGYGISAALSLLLCLCRKTQSVLPLGTLPAHASFCARRALTCTCGHRPVPAA
jgi:hypothetical protein